MFENSGSQEELCHEEGRGGGKGLPLHVVSSGRKVSENLLSWAHQMNGSIAKKVCIYRCIHPLFKKRHPVLILLLSPHLLHISDLDSDAFSKNGKIRCFCGLQNGGPTVLTLKCSHLDSFYLIKK
jgi:hypothetical protein